jgi:hypothetical protein
MSDDTTHELDREQLQNVRDVIAYAGGKLREDEDFHALQESYNQAVDALGMDTSKIEVPEEWEGETDGGRDLPVQFDRAGSEAGTPADALDDLQAGDRVLWSDRSQPLTVARVVDEDDPEGQALTASVIRRDPEEFRSPSYPGPDYTVGRDLEKGDVFLDPTNWRTPAGRTFAVVQGPQGGFYLLAEDSQNPHSGRLVLFRCVRDSHKTVKGRRGEGAFKYEGEIDVLELVERGDAPDELDPEGDLVRYDEIAENTLVVYDPDREEIGHVEVGTVEEAFSAGLRNAVESARAAARNRLDEGDDEDEGTLPEVEAVENSPAGSPVGTCRVTGVFTSEYGPKAVVETPAPWEVPDYEQPANEVLKSTPWEENHRGFDPDREAWTVDLDELVTTARVLSENGYAVVVEEDALAEPPA